MLHDKTHISLFSRESLLRFLENSGFKIFNMDYPFFKTEYFNRKNILKLFTKTKNYSPSFFGNIFIVTSKKM